MWQHPCWKILGIEATDQIKEIKRAYAKRSKEIHPEDHPEEFMQLHNAYEQAMAFAKHEEKQSSFIPSDIIKVSPVETNEDASNDFDFNTIFKQSEHLQKQQIKQLRDHVFHELCVLLKNKSATLDDWLHFIEQDSFYYISSNDDEFLEQLCTYIKKHKLSMLSTRVLHRFFSELSQYDESSRYEHLLEELNHQLTYWEERQAEKPLIRAFFSGSMLMFVGAFLSCLFQNETFHLTSMIIFCLYACYIKFFSKKRVGNRKLKNPLSYLAILLSLVVLFSTYFFLMHQNIIK